MREDSGIIQGQHLQTLKSKLSGDVSRDIANVLDLGHQLGLLWASTDDTNQAAMIFEQVLVVLTHLPHDWNYGTVARLDRSVAALVEVLLKSDTEKAHKTEKKWLGELAVSFDGISVEFLTF